MGTPNPDSEMAEGDDDDDDDEGDDGDDGDDDDQEDGERQGDDANDSKVQDEEMTDVVDETKPPTPSKPVVDAMDGIAQTDAVPPNPLTLAPPLASLATGSPKTEGSPLKIVMLQSPTEAQAPVALPPTTDALTESAPEPEPVPETALVPGLALEPSHLTDGESKTESMIAEPPSTVAGDDGKAPAGVDAAMTEVTTQEPPKAAEHVDIENVEPSRSEEAPKDPSPPRISSPDVASRESALLPPPPDQVGNISSPKAEDGHDRVSDNENKSKDNNQNESAVVPERPPLHAHDSVMTEDTIKPEDSASVRFPESGAPSEVGTASAEDTKDSAMTAAAEAMEVDQKDPSPEQISPVTGAKEDEPALFHAVPVVEETEPSGETKEETPKAATPPLLDTAVADAAEPKISPPVVDTEPIPETKEPSPPAPLPEITNDEPMAAPPEPEKSPLEEPSVEKADVPVEEEKPEPPVEQAEPEKEEIKDEPVEELVEEPKIEPVPEPAAEPVAEATPTDLPAENTALPVPPAPVEVPVTEAVPEPQPVEAEEKKEDPPANA